MAAWEYSFKNLPRRPWRGECFEATIGHNGIERTKKFYGKNRLSQACEWIEMLRKRGSLRNNQDKYFSKLSDRAKASAVIA